MSKASPNDKRTPAEKAKETRMINFIKNKAVYNQVDRLLFGEVIFLRFLQR